MNEQEQADILAQGRQIADSLLLETLLTMDDWERAVFDARVDYWGMSADAAAYMTRYGVSPFDNDDGL